MILGEEYRSVGWERNLPRDVVFSDFFKKIHFHWSEISAEQTNYSAKTCVMSPTSCKCATLKK